MQAIDREELKRFAKRYIWWEIPEKAIELPQRVVAQVMNIGDYDDVQALAKQVGEDYLRDVLTRAEIGQFNARSWLYWHYRSGLANRPDEIPPLPARKIEWNPGKDRDYGTPVNLDPPVTAGRRVRQRRPALLL